MPRKYRYFEPSMTCSALSQNGSRRRLSCRKFVTRCSREHVQKPFTACDLQKPFTGCDAVAVGESTTTLPGICWKLSSLSVNSVRFCKISSNVFVSGRLRFSGKEFKVSDVIGMLTSCLRAPPFCPWRPLTQVRAQQSRGTDLGLKMVSSRCYLEEEEQKVQEERKLEKKNQTMSMWNSPHHCRLLFSPQQI